MINPMIRSVLLAALIAPLLAHAGEVELEKTAVQKFAIANREAFDKGIAFNMKIATSLVAALMGTPEGAAVRAKALAFRNDPDKASWSHDRELRAANYAMLMAWSKKESIGGGHQSCQYKWANGYLTSEIDHCWDDSSTFKAWDFYVDGSQGFYEYPVVEVVQPFWIWEHSHMKETPARFHFESLMDNGMYDIKDPTKILIGASSGYMQKKSSVNLATLEERADIQLEYRTNELMVDLVTGEITEQISADLNCSYNLSVGGKVIGCGRALINGSYTDMYYKRGELKLDVLTDEEKIANATLLIN